MRLDAFLTQAPMATAVSGSSMPQASVLSASLSGILPLHARQGGTRVQEGLARGRHQPAAISLQACLDVKPVQMGLVYARGIHCEVCWLLQKVRALDERRTVSGV